MDRKSQPTRERLLDKLDQAQINLENAERTNQTLADQLTGAAAHNRALSAGLEAALRHFRLAPFAYDSADDWAAHDRLLKELESLL